MIELNKKTQQDFLNREWVQRLLDAGVNMNDAKYHIVISGFDNKEYITEAPKQAVSRIYTGIPTYTVSELLYKLHEWIYPTIEGKEYSGGLTMIKDAPFYIFYYDLKTSNYDKKLASEKQVNEWNDTYISAEFEYPIESLASLLIQCHKKDIGIKNKEGKQISDVGNISCK
jgi:hypothetical protein